MNKKDFQSRKKQIKLELQSDSEFAQELIDQLIRELFQEEDFIKITELYQSNYYINTFEVAFSLSQTNLKEDSMVLYEDLLSTSPNNAAILNNLASLKRDFGKIQEAFLLIHRAYEIDSSDEIIIKNFESISDQINERKEIDSTFKSALNFLEKEHDFVISKLKEFIKNSKRDDQFKNYVIPIPKWKFKALMKTDEQKSVSLLEQWLEKGYLRKTGKRGQYRELIYELNPYLEEAINSLKPVKINQNWIDGFEKLDIAFLEEYSYFELKKKVSKVKKNIRDILDRDLDELFFNFAVQNKKSIVILSGSIVEVLLIYFLEKKKISRVSYSRNGRNVNKKLHQCDLGDLIDYIEQNRMTENIVVHMVHVSRIYRNYIHPGKELREGEVLNLSKAKLCFISTIEIVRAIC